MNGNENQSTPFNQSITFKLKPPFRALGMEKQMLLACKAACMFFSFEKGAQACAQQKTSSSGYRTYNPT